MVKRIYIDNYKAFSNFSFEPQNVQLIYGGNGSGKTSLFEALNLLRGFVVAGLRTDEVFHDWTLTRWDRRAIQTFEIEVQGNGGHFTYRLELHFMATGGNAAVHLESLQFDGRPLFPLGVG